MRWILAALILLGCTFTPAPISALAPQTDPVLRALEVWNAGFPPEGGTFWIETNQEMFASGMTSCVARVIAIKSGLAPEIVLFVTLHELTHLRLGCKESDHDPQDLLMLPEYDSRLTLHRMRRILHTCQTAACVNSQVFSPELRARIIAATPQ